MDPIKLLAYIVALIIVVAVAYNLIGGAFEQGYTPIPMQPSAWLEAKNMRLACPSANSSNVDAYHIDFLKILGGVDYDYIFNVNLSDLNVTKYMVEYAKLGLLIPIGFIHNGSAYELHMLPVSEEDKENLTARGIYLCLPPRVFYPLFAVRNSTSELFIKNTTVLWSVPLLGWGDYQAWVNVATPPPYAELNTSVDVGVVNYTVVVGSVDVVGVDVDIVGELVEGPFCGVTCVFGFCYRECHTYVYRVYRFAVRYVYTLKVSGRVAEAVESSLDLLYVAKNDELFEAGFGEYRGFKDFAKIVVDARASRYEECRFDNGTNNCTILYHMGSLYIYPNWRGLRIPVVTANITLNTVEALTGVKPINTSILGTAFTLSIGDVTRIPIEFYDSIDVCSYLGLGDMYAVRCLSYYPNLDLTRKSFAGYLELRYIVKDFDWPWGSVIELPYEIAVEKKLYPPPYAPDVDLNRMFYGYLQEAVLKHIANIVDGYTSRTGYREFEAWALSTQVPIQMDVCDDHSYSYMSLVEALSDGCGSDLERAEILSRILSNLNIMNEVKDVTVRVARGLEIVYEQGRAVIGYIDSYPPFYNLTSCCTMYADGRYMVVYDTVQNSVFSVLDRIEWMD